MPRATVVYWPQHTGYPVTRVRQKDIPKQRATMSQIFVFPFLCYFATCHRPAILCETELPHSWKQLTSVGHSLQTSEEVSGLCHWHDHHEPSAPRAFQVLQSIPWPGTTSTTNIYATKGYGSGSSGIQTVGQCCQHLCAKLQQDSALPHTTDLQQPLHLEIFGFPAWNELHRDYHIGYWSVSSLNHTQITAGKYNATRFRGKGRALPEV